MSRDQGGQIKKQSYINANLFFSISYPEAWASSLLPPEQTLYPADSVIWEVNKEQLPGKHLTLAVVAITRTSIVSGREIMQEVLTDLYPNFTVNSLEAGNLPAGPAVVLHGYTPQQTFRVWLINGAYRQYLIICAAAPEQFAERIPLFAEIAQSFQTLR